MKLEDLLQDKNLLNLKYKIIQKYPGLDKDDIESAYAFSVWKAKERYNPFKSKFTSFFYLIFQKECINMCRKNRIKPLPLKIDIEKLKDKFDQEMQELSEENRKLLIARYLEQKTLREIGDELGVSYEVVRQRIKKCLKKIKENL